MIDLNIPVGVEKCSRRAAAESAIVALIEVEQDLVGREPSRKHERAVEGEVSHSRRDVDDDRPASVAVDGKGSAREAAGGFQGENFVAAAVQLARAGIDQTPGRDGQRGTGLPAQSLREGVEIGEGAANHRHAGADGAGDSNTTDDTARAAARCYVTGFREVEVDGPRSVELRLSGAANPDVSSHVRVVILQLLAAVPLVEDRETRRTVQAETGMSRGHR